MRVKRGPFARRQEVVDGHPDDAMREHYRVRADQDVGGDEFVGSCPTLVRTQACEPDGLAERGVVAEHRRGFGKGLRRRIHPGQPARDLAAHRIRCCRPRDLAGTDCVRDGHHEVRVSARLRKDGFRQVRVDVAVGKCVGKQRAHRGPSEVGGTDRSPTRRIR